MFLCSAPEQSRSTTKNRHGYGEKKVEVAEQS